MDQLNFSIEVSLGPRELRCKNVARSHGPNPKSMNRTSSIRGFDMRRKFCKALLVLCCLSFGQSSFAQKELTYDLSGPALCQRTELFSPARITHEFLIEETGEKLYLHLGHDADKDLLTSMQVETSNVTVDVPERFISMFGPPHFAFMLEYTIRDDHGSLTDFSINFAYSPYSEPERFGYTALAEISFCDGEVVLVESTELNGETELLYATDNFDCSPRIAE